MKFLKKLVVLCCFSSSVFAANTDDTISIQQVFVTEDGSFAVQATEVIENASADRDCAPGKSWAKSWAGFGATVSERMVSVILSAQAQKKSIQIRTSGCQGDWHKITSIYIKP
ncbi:hypothetical protein [Pseudoalteromonas luteoviolacea]|uniref:Uncharacterized protein n=1 Tax=Pseudoalteromonas luteoviolacea S4054 TaxID=1129367 RepID=A0A0F6AIM4_9GAMM|nr:hypothetical protein [Pseudoalteromonas luteoviolacea]AOT08748.1 hypothetical protein S4054249_13190 [Pseudoalteromonas luteoviolacea]AOT13662.1 hypothetical protein S40542_13160 [Pseudoalteromonas luteoviolacea]AOT18576.1 hypothetical protein S4054_13165 [Pseudoalteromonas luteoviolacea]KKE85454.1 hypothetical protein N479_26010 [Pseudoalteromonas luteoviolacea S4054]KZN64942.1 hypothetical protein N481_25250 [Pseudoalteromonas luteoviolacea S4047-1]